MRARTERLAHPFPTARAILTGVLWGNCYHVDAMHCCIVVHPSQELPPGRVVNTFGECAVLHHVGYLKVFIGNQIARRDERACLFAGKVFTLPLHFQIRFCQVLPGFLSIG